MNILMVGPDSNAKGGMATVIKNFKEYYSGPNKIFYLNSWTENNAKVTGLKAIFTIRKMIRQNKIEIVHFHVAQNGSFFRKVLLAKLVPQKVKIIFHMHASQFDVFYDHAAKPLKIWIKKRLDYVDYIVALSDEWETFYTAITKTKIKVIENAVNVPESVNYNVNSNQIITLGRLGQRKGTYDILKIAGVMQDKFPEIKFILYGDGEITEVSHKIKQLGLVNVKIGGWLNGNDRKVAIKNSLIHVLPSYHEGLPMAVLETMAYGVPNITTNIGGMPQVIKNHANGILLSPGDTSALEHELTNLLKKRYILKTYSKSAADTIKKEYSLSTYFKKWNNLYIQGVTLNE
ncbi:glycosyltransferase family 4 protein [Latilactobacillus fragifolii]|uniref:glycosyltransferase family 4 protein n=1 Tax=Latilactobacillus fragifolii TaxID=2814244 RepID=UPI001ABA821C|nr:glycosyltransferase family 4 protein [Latilactobacillus fragifolii]